MTTSYKVRYEKLLKRNKDLTKETKQLVNLIFRIKKKCDDNNLWLGASCDPKLPLEDAAQQGPLVTKLFEMAGKIKNRV